MSISLSDYYKNVLMFSDPELMKLVINTSTVKSVPKNTTIIEVEDEQHDVPFLIRGITVGLIIDADGKESVDCISSTPGEVLVGYYHLGNSDDLATKSEVRIVTVTDCEIVSVPLFIVNIIVRKYPEATQLYIRLLEDASRRHRSIKQMLYLRTPAQRLKWFVETYPEFATLLTDRDVKPREKALKHKHVASLLNITPQTLSKLLNE